MGKGDEIVGDALDGFTILDRLYRSSIQRQSPSLTLFGITTDFQVGGDIHLNRRKDVDHDADGIAEQVLAAPS